MVTNRKRGRGPRHPAPLVAWLGDRVVGEWSVREGEHRFQYAESWTAAPDAHGLSLSLPWTPDGTPLRGEPVRIWFDNLLPDDIALRRRWQERLGPTDADAFDLLSALGGDCIGALRLLPPGATPAASDDGADATPLDEADVERVLDAVLAPARRGGANAVDGAPRVALPGAQEKTALLRRDGRWFRPGDGAPSTHILKLPLGRIGRLQAELQADPRDAVWNEWLCARVLAGFGLPVAACEVARFGRHEVLVVERFDRVAPVANGAGADDAAIVRLPQEDLCQALGVPGERRYEADGGPGLRDVLRVLEGGSRADADRTSFVRTQMIFWLLAATDGHARNHSIFLEAGGGHRLAPCYDVHSSWPLIGTGAGRPTAAQARLALAPRSKSAHRGLADLRAAHWDEVARLAGMGDAGLLRDEIAERLPQVLARVESGLPPEAPAPLVTAILDGMRTLAPRLHAAD